MGNKGFAIEVNYCSTLPVEANRKIACISKERIRTSVLSSTLKEMESNMEKEISKKIWIESAATGEIPKEVKISVNVCGELALLYEESFGDRFSLSPEKIGEAIDFINTFSKKLAVQIAKDLPLKIVHSKVFKEANQY